MYMLVHGGDIMLVGYKEDLKICKADFEDDLLIKIPKFM